MNKNGLPIYMTSPETMTPALTIHVGASNTGWEVKSEILEASGYWTGRKRDFNQCKGTEDDLVCCCDGLCAVKPDSFIKPAI
jgi:hypothetical protein